ncbi:nitroreductase [Acidovorax sp. NO-1]|uniref:nitroreductase family protein n=1 Tax=Acidovorax sp. NO-1 TaxID=512030 RepID=UPI000A2ED4FD|nr:nitroreductase [Acidovorax sp. NO-1]
MGHVEPETSPFSPVQASVHVPDSRASVSSFADALITSRQNVSPKRLVEPGPNFLQLDQIFRSAASAPDHGLVKPWRFVIVPQDKRALLAEVFAIALVDRDPGATLEQIEAAREKAYRAPMLMLVVAQLGVCEPPIPAMERLVSVGAAVQNMLLMAHGQGFGCSLTSGQAMQSNRMRQLFDLKAGEEAICFLNIGTASERKTQRRHPEVTSFVSTL